VREDTTTGAEQPPHPFDGRFADAPNSRVATPGGLPDPALEITLTE